jgi:hypothetical protein
MSHEVRLFAGPRRALARIRELLPAAAVFALTPGAEIAVLPLDDDLHDALHRHYGTGSWHEDTAFGLSTGDMAFAADVSRAAPVAWLETSYAGGNGTQSAALWIGGALAVGPLSLDAGKAKSRPPAFWPINVALRGLGIVATTGRDEFQTFGLAGYRSNDAIKAQAFPLSPAV